MPLGQRLFGRRETKGVKQNQSTRARLRAAVGALPQVGVEPLEQRVLLSSPTVTVANISISGATGTGGAYRIGDTVTVTWDNSASGDSNPDISSVSVDFSQFGGGVVVANPPLLQTFSHPTSGGDSLLGWSVAALGENLLVSVPWDDTGANGAGIVYLFDGATGELLRTFLNPTPESGEHFGMCVTAVGNNALIGAYRDDTGATDSGAAYLFNGATGELLLTFVNPTPDAGDEFGGNVAALGDDVLVGAYNDDTGAINAGAVYLFDGTTGELLRTFLDPNPVENGYFGCTVAALGNDVLIGACGDNAGAPHAGAAYLFDGSTGELLLTFLNPTPADGDWFGDCLAAAGNNVLIGAYLDDTGATDSGAAYLFDGSTGALLQIFLNPTPANGEHFGSVAAVGNNILVGAAQVSDGGTYVGMAYLFDAATGQLLQTIHNPTPASYDWFGWTVGALGGQALVAAPFDEAVYLFGQTGTWTASYTITAGSIDATGRNVVLTGMDDAGNHTITIDDANATVDNVAPAAPILTSISDDTGSSGSDHLTRDNTLILHGTAEADSTIQFFRDGSPIGGTAATSIGEWHFDYRMVTLPDGAYTFTATATDGAGNTSPLSDPFQVTVDTLAPRIADVSVRGSGWNENYLPDGFSIPVGSSDQLKNLPWTNLNQILVRFSEDVAVDLADLILSSGRTPGTPYANSMFSYDPITYTGTWTLASAIGAADKLRINLNADGAGAVTDTAGNRLDGEWVDSSDTYATGGDGIEGGIFRFRFNVLPGDVNQSNGVTGSDVTQVKNAQGQVPGGLLYSIFKDVNGSNSITGSDVTLVKNRQGTLLPLTDPDEPLFAEEGDILELLLAKRGRSEKWS